MNAIRKRMSAATVLALSLTLWACENVGDVTRPTLEPTNEIHEVLVVLGKKGTTVVKQTDFTVGTAAATIGPNGGELNLANRVILKVPAGAVSAPTLFTMTKLDGDHLEVDLKATRVLPNDVGSRGFDVPLQLTFSYQGAANLPGDIDDMKVYHVKLFGGLEEQPTVVDASGKRVTASVSHFSIYAVGWPE